MEDGRAGESRGKWRDVDPGLRMERRMEDEVVDLVKGLMIEMMGGDEVRESADGRIGDHVGRRTGSLRRI